MRSSRLVVAILTLALLPAAPAAAAIASSDATTTSAAGPTGHAAAKQKKKCKKGYERKRVRRNGKRVVRCVKKKKRRSQRPANPGNPGVTGPPPAADPPAVADPAATWRSLVAGASFTYSTFNATSGGSSKTVFNFCADGGSFTYYYEFVGSVYNEAKNRNGTYTLNKAEAGADGAGQFVDGLIDYQSNIEEKPAGQAVVRVYPGNPGLAYINSGDGAAEFSRTTPSGC